MIKKTIVKHGAQELRSSWNNNGMKHSGTSLIECMIYITLFILLLYWLIPWTIAAFSTNNMLYASAHRTLDCCTAGDIFVKDIHDASCQKQLWFVVEPHMIVWKKNDGTYVGWEYKNNTLYRIVGIFNGSTWSKKSRTLLTTHVAHALFSIQYHDAGTINTVTCTAVIDHQHYFFTGAPRYAYS